MIRKTKTDEEKLVPIHVRVPKRLFLRLLKRRDELRVKLPMANLTDAVRSALEQGLSS